MSDQPDVVVTEQDRADARASVRKTSRGSSIGGITLVAVMSVAAAAIAPAVVSGLDTGHALVVAAFTIAFAVPVLVSFSHLATSKATRSGAISTAQERTMKGEARRREFEAHLANELAMAEDDPRCSRRWSGRSQRHCHPCRSRCYWQTTATLTWPAWSCHLPPVRRPAARWIPDQCPAARRSQVQRFADSDALGVCPKLRGRPEGRCSGVCVPVSIMGRAVGVIHATGEPGVVVDELTVQDLQTLANQAGARLGMHRIMAETQLQASTDNLTGF
jgi:hypothetical protein